MDIDPKTYPSRTFARFTAHNQLVADATGRTITASVQRLGGQTYMQEAIPDGEMPSLSQNPSGFAAGFTMGLSVKPTTPESTPPGSSDKDRNSPSDQVSSLEPENQLSNSGLDEALFEEIVKTTLNPQQYPELYQCCGTQKAAMAVEDRVAAEIVTAYRFIKQKQACPIVQSLNQLL
jgi:hypothetical protein